MSTGSSRKRSAAPPETFDVSDARGSVGVQLAPKFRPVPDIPPPPIEPPKDQPSAPAEPVAPDQVPQPPPGSRVVRNPAVLYPDEYSTLKKEHIVFAKEPQASREGGGQMLFMSRLFPDGKVKPLLINTPNSMFAPTGVTTWSDGKTTMLLSTGRDWEMNPLMGSFRALLTMIQERAAEVAVEKEWNSPNQNNVEAVLSQFTPLMFVGEGDKGEPYPPSIKATVMIAGNNRTEFFEYSAEPPMRPLVPADVIASSTITSVIHLPWVYRKKAKKAWQFSIRTNVFQAVVEMPSGRGIPRNGCSVQV
jgi:hypothetical protein